jgi:LysM repeat protein
MNTPSPLVPQGTLPDRGKSRIRIIVFAIIAAHVFMLGVFLIAGCKKTTTETAQQEPAPPPVTPPVEPSPLSPPGTTSAPAASPNSLVTATAPVAPPDTNYIPPPPPSIENTLLPTLSEHTIIKGDTFAILAKKYGVTTKAIEAANPGVNPTRLKIGQKIKIPPPKPASNGSGSANGLTAADGMEKTYTVKSGDNLLKIAKAYGVTVKQLRSYNNLRTDQIKVGQKLKIPAKAPPVETTSPPPTTPPLTNP